MNPDRQTCPVAAAAVSTWALAFAAIHWYWAVGGRAGLGEQTSAADAALSTGWFAAYNLGVAAVSTLVCGLTASAVRPRLNRIARRRLAHLCLVGAIVLSARGVVGIALLVPEILSGEIERRPLILQLIEPGFLLGGALFLSLRVSLAGQPAQALHHQPRR